jgi:methyl coenzyme M reductase subunit C-like uncharacterized protein (methanogenesis marker protein 7)
MTPHEETKLVILGFIETLPNEDKEKVKECANDLRQKMKEFPMHWGLAIALVGAEVAAQE